MEGKTPALDQFMIEVEAIRDAATKTAEEVAHCMTRGEALVYLMGQKDEAYHAIMGAKEDRDRTYQFTRFMLLEKFIRAVATERTLLD